MNKKILIVVALLLVAGYFVWRAWYNQIKTTEEDIQNNWDLLT